MTQRIRCGIIGAGVIAPVHIQSYQKLENVEVTWVCDLIEEKARKRAAEYSIAGVSAIYRELLEDPTVDCVSICTDHASHAQIAADALAAGKHVICEKALAASTAGLRQMFAAHATHPELLFAGIFQHRFDPVNQCLKRLIEEGAFGTLLTAGVQMRCLRTDGYYLGDPWRGTWDLEGGAVLINQAIHYIDLLVWAMGGVESLSGYYANLTHGAVMETEDTAVASLSFRSGALGTVEATCSSHLGWEPTLSIHGSTGSLDLRHDKVLKLSFQDEVVGKQVAEELASSKEQAGVAAGKNYYGTGHPAQLADFIDAIRGNRQPFVTAASARHTVEVVLAIYEAQRTGARVSLPANQAQVAAVVA